MKSLIHTNNHKDFFLKMKDSNLDNLPRRFLKAHHLENLPHLESNNSSSMNRIETMNLVIAMIQKKLVAGKTVQIQVRCMGTTKEELGLVILNPI